MNMNQTSGPSDASTAQAFSTSWNNLPSGSVYTTHQVDDWMSPLRREDIQGRDVLELGCGNASLLVHVAALNPARITGVDLGDSVIAARKNMQSVQGTDWEIVQSDLTTFYSEGFDVVYCIGVLHHLKKPRAGFDAVLRNVRPGGRFHCWVYAHEGNGVVRLFVEPIRKFACRLPWWVTKYLLATPLVIPYFVYAKAIRGLTSGGRNAWSKHLKALPLFDYSLWIAERDFAFFRHVAFDQLVTPQTAYMRRSEVEAWLEDDRIKKDSTYMVFRNGNSWKFGGLATNDQA